MVVSMGSPPSEAATAALVRAAEKVAVAAAEHTARTEAARDLPPEVVGAVVEAGFARHFVPERFGGAAGPGGTGTARSSSQGRDPEAPHGCRLAGTA